MGLLNPVKNQFCANAPTVIRTEMALSEKKQQFVHEKFIFLTGFVNRSF